MRPFPDVSAKRIPVSIDGGRQPKWSADGNERFYLERVAPERRLWSARFSTEPDVQILERTMLFSYFQDFFALIEARLAAER